MNAKVLTLMMPVRSLLKRLLYLALPKESGPVMFIRRLDEKIRAGSLIKGGGWKKAKRYPAGEFGVNVAGYLTGEFGLGEAVRGDVVCLKSTGIPYALNNFEVPEHSNLDKSLDGFTDANPYRYNLIHINPDSMDAFILKKSDVYFKDKYNIAFWVWEFPDFPEKYWSLFKYFDEIWTPSGFSAEAIARVSPVPVLKVPHAINIGGANPGKAFFKIPDDEFTFLIMFDFCSYIERKNPLGAVAAFRKAFGQGKKARLAIKHINSHLHPEHLELFNRELDGLNVQTITPHMRREEVCGLIASCDCYVSLHRSEGFGLTIAEAMALGKPVIATDFSGNTDFMDVSNSLPVSYNLAPLEDDFGAYEKGTCWADPDIDHAARLMRLVYEDADLNKKISSRAKEDIKVKYSPAAVGKCYKRRLELLERDWR